MTEAKEPLKLYLDDDKEPFKVAYPPLRFHFNTIALPDGPHKLRVEASNGLAPPTLRELPFHVRNGVAITVYGLEQQQTIGGQVELIINAYAGNTEVDFEPRRAETPQPIPTWSWVLFLAIAAWGMFYVLNPTLQPRDAVASAATSASLARTKGQQIYVDTCARCHGEDGAGQRAGPEAVVVPPLRNSDVAVAETPERLLSRVVAGIKHTMMPAWGPRLSNEEILAVVNTVRTAWDHNGSTIEPRHRTPPPGVQELESTLLEALRTKDSTRLGTCCWPSDVKPQLYRVDGIHEMDLKGVKQAWEDYLEALGAGRIENLQLLDARYDYDNPEPTVVVGWGRIFLDTVTALGKPDRAIGRFIRVYQKSRRSGQWAIVFDFADIPMRVGCLPTDGVAPGPAGEPPCPVPGPEPEVVVGPTAPTVGPEPVTPPVDGAPVSSIGYAEVQKLIAGLKKGAKASPHDNFWELPYADFVAYEFEDYTDGTKMKLLIPYDGKNSNLVKAMRTGKGVAVTKPDGTPGTRDLVRMPKNAAPMSDADIDLIEAWIDAGAPEVAGQPSALPRPGGAGAAAAPTPPTAPTAAGTSRVSDMGYADVQKLIAGLKKGAKASPHDNFWELPYADFVAYEFEDYTDGTKMKLLVPYDGKNSNLVKAMRTGKAVAVTKPDGTPGTRDLVRMPKNAAPMSDADIDRIERWIDAGAPEFAGKPSALPEPGGATSAPPGETPAPPAPPAGGFPPPSGGFPPPGPGPEQPGGFPPPGAAPPAPGGFPAPQAPPEPPPQPPAGGGGGFPAPAPAPQQPGGGFPPPAPPPSGGFPPPSAPSR